MACAHQWIEGKALSGQTCVLTCAGCGGERVAKPRVPNVRPTAANELLALQLLVLLRARGVRLRAVKAEPLLAAQSPWPHPGVAFERLPKHGRATKARLPPAGTQWPGWLYDFDRWICRLDGDGDSNLLLLDGALLPIDWGCAFVWAGPFSIPSLLRRVDDLDVPCHAQARDARDPRALRAIARVSDNEIRAAVASVPRDLLPECLAAAYWSGLCMRRDLLAKEIGS